MPMSTPIGDLYYLEQMLMNLGRVALAQGDRPAARSRFTEGLRIARQTDDRLGQASFVGRLGVLAAGSGQARVAARLLGAAHSLGSAAGAGSAGPLEPELRAARDAAIRAMGVPRYEAEYAAGERLDRDEALRLALGEPAHVDVDANEPVDPGPLSKREVEVARLIAEGLANREIGARLFISERTVTTHVGNILNKLGFDSRVQIASWIAGSSS
jgi:DNA-binding CsgD family transcriptional regulator